VVEIDNLLKLLALPGTLVSMSERDISRYAIFGTYDHVDLGEGIPFGGFFFYSAESFGLYGSLTEQCSRPYFSSIGGTMLENRLEFVKIYDYKPERIQFRFVKKGDIWVGTYEGLDEGYNKVWCKTHCLERSR